VHVREGDTVTVRIKDSGNKFVRDTQTVPAQPDGKATITFEVDR
jgi:hypothetical protein